MKHTPGPWKTRIEETKRFDSFTGEPRHETNYFIMADEKTIGVASSYVVEKMSNANLIAAAPEMLEALESLFNHGRIKAALSLTEMNRIEILIKKAKGE